MMSSISVRRRQIVGGLSVGVMGGVWPTLLQAQTATLSATTFAGPWEEAHRSILAPAFRRATGANVTLTPSFALDTIAKIRAAAQTPPFDVMINDEGPFAASKDQGIYRPIPRSSLPNLADIPDRFVDPSGLGVNVSLQVLGIVYNPEKIRTPPKSWRDFWRPEYKGRVGITSLASTLGMIWLVEVAKLHGGNEGNLEPGFQALRQLLPNLGAIAPNPGTLSALFQQGQIDIAYNSLNNIAPLKARGVPIAIAKPESGWVLMRNIMNVVNNTKNPELAAAYINTYLSADVQQAMANAPYFLAPLNKRAVFSPELKAIGSDINELASQVTTDWSRVNPQRSALIERFNREIRI